MDDVVRQAMAKWPNVPHCFGWLRLDARGHWRMRDERAQQLNLPGDKIRHLALLDFINRNYQCDTSGQWYFQNGPQRVYVDLELTPYIARLDPAAGHLLHTGTALPTPAQIWLTPAGQLLMPFEQSVAALDDRDMASLLPRLQVGDSAASDQQIMDWLEGDDCIALQLRYSDSVLPVQRTAATPLAEQFGFIMRPRGSD